MWEQGVAITGDRWGCVKGFGREDMTSELGALQTDGRQGWGVVGLLSGSGNSSQKSTGA